ncbi:MAG: VTT domain-containing protein [Candidatus Zambryskibacteria bacterium]|nr:VTT domain-containing protein [Candidatus Zambryskibacteria bacterium]
MPSFFDPQNILSTVGYIGLFFVVFAESGILFGFFFPGDSLLFTAGLMAGTGTLNILILLLVTPVAAILGDSAGYSFGKWIGPKIFNREDSFFFNKKHISRAKGFYEKYGPKAIVLARFMPIVRTFVPILAGVGEMKYKTFFTYNIIGGILWSVGFTLLGFSLGKTFPQIQDYIFWAIGIIVLASLIPMAIEWWKNRDRN